MPQSSRTMVTARAWRSQRARSGGAGWGAAAVCRTTKSGRTVCMSLIEVREGRTDAGRLLGEDAELLVAERHLVDRDDHRGDAHVQRPLPLLPFLPDWMVGADHGLLQTRVDQVL